MNQFEKEFNITCADFLGWRRRGMVDLFYYIKDDNTEVEICDLKFHIDWNWIHEVVDNIKLLTNPNANSDTTFSTKKYEIRHHLGISNKEGVIKEINKFLIWYNKTNKS